MILSTGELTLMYDRRPIELFHFKDTSPFAMCLQVAEAPKVDTVITIRYQHQYQQIEVDGRVIWQEPDPTGINCTRHWIGMSFYPNRQEQNINLFNLLQGHKL